MYAFFDNLMSVNYELKNQKPHMNSLKQKVISHFEGVRKAYNLPQRGNSVLRQLQHNRMQQTSSHWKAGKDKSLD